MTNHKVPQFLWQNNTRKIEKQKEIILHYLKMRRAWLHTYTCSKPISSVLWIHHTGPWIHGLLLLIFCKLPMYTKCTIKQKWKRYNVHQMLHNKNGAHKFSFFFWSLGCSYFLAFCFWQSNDPSRGNLTHKLFPF